MASHWMTNLGYVSQKGVGRGFGFWGEGVCCFFIISKTFESKL